MSHTLILNDPLTIGPRLVPCLDLGAGNRIHILLSTLAAEDGRSRWRYVIEIDGVEAYRDADLTTPTLDDPSEMVREAFAALVDFLTAAAESYAGNGMAVVADTSSDMFPESVTAWAHAHEQELGNAAWLLADEKGE